MNHYRAAQRELDGRFDYVCGNQRTGTYPIGYCAGWKEVKDFGSVGILTAGLSSEIEGLRPHQEKYHRDGHATEAEACECYRRYLLDTRLRLRDPALLARQPDTLHKCQAPSPIEIGTKWRNKHSPGAPLSTIVDLSAIGDIWLDTDSRGWTGHTPLAFFKGYEAVNGCQNYTAGLAEVDHQHWYLCDEHRTAAVVEQLFGKIYQAWGSW